MQIRLRNRPEPAPTLSSTPSPRGLLQRKCACGGAPRPSGQCEECREKRLQRKSNNAGLERQNDSEVPPIVHEVLRSPGQPLGEDTRTFMESRFGHDFNSVRVHTDAKAAESAKEVNALAYTFGRDVVFGSGQFNPHNDTGRRLLAHELVHVLQQRGKDESSLESRPAVEQSLDGGYRLAVGPALQNEPPGLENEAHATAASVLDIDNERAASPAGRSLQIGETNLLAIQRTRIPLPDNVPLCGKTLTHIDVEPPRALPLEPCLPPTVLVTRINLVGRDLTVPTPGRGSQVFNLHLGYYQHPATGFYCAIADDSKMCVAPRCQILGCFPTLQQVLEAILEFVKTVLVVLGIIVLAILVALIIELLAPVLIPILLVAEMKANEGGAEAEA